MKRREKILVDATKITAELEKRGRTPRKAATEMGFNPQYFNNIGARGYIAPSGLMLLEKMYNIHLDDIKPDEPEPVLEPPIEPSDVTMADIYVQLSDIKVALNKIGALQAELLKAWAPKG